MADNSTQWLAQKGTQVILTFVLILLTIKFISVFSMTNRYLLFLSFLAVVFLLGIEMVINQRHSSAYLILLAVPLIYLISLPFIWDVSPIYIWRSLQILYVERFRKTDVTILLLTANTVMIAYICYRSGAGEVLLLRLVSFQVLFVVIFTLLFNLEWRIRLDYLLPRFLR